MTEHRVPLRGGWACRAAGSAESETRRLELPVRWGFDGARRLVLSRRFGRPPLDEGRQFVFLQMDQVRGILSLALNGQPIAPVAVETSHYEIEVTNLGERNLLTLEIETPGEGPSSGGSLEEWGVIALVIRTVETETVSGCAGPLASSGEST